jgi:PAS domain S-box-containing protein
MGKTEADAAGREQPPRRVTDPTWPENLIGVLVRSVVDYAIFVLDPDGFVMTWNAGAERLKGYRPDEIIGCHFSTFYPDDDVTAGKPDQELAIAVADGHHEDEGWRVRSDGTRFWANVVITALRGDDGRLLGFGKVTRDLTERRRGEEALRESEERFRLLVSGVADYAIFLLDNDGRVASWNLGAERLKGYRADEIIGQSFANFYTEEDRRGRVPEGALRQADGEGRWADEGWRVRKDGTRFWASVVITRLIGSDGTKQGFAKVTRDLTERKRGEDALRGVLERERDTAAQLREVDRMRSDLVSSVAHDLRAPVGVIQSYLELLRADWGGSTEEKKLEALDLITQRMGTLAALVDDVFDLVRIDAGHLEVVRQAFDLAAVVSDGVADGRSAAPGIDVEVTTEPDTWAFGDPRRTWQVVANLVSNAVKFSAADTAVRVDIGRQGDEVVVAITDQGPGIAPDQHEVIFERFTRLATASGAPGSGLGLFIARSVAVSQGGRIDVDSTPGAGSTFRLWLPAAEPGSH